MRIIGPNLIKVYDGFWRVNGSFPENIAEDLAEQLRQLFPNVLINTQEYFVYIQQPDEGRDEYYTVTMTFKNDADEAEFIMKEI